MTPPPNCAERSGRHRHIVGLFGTPVSREQVEPGGEHGRVVCAAGVVPAGQRRRLLDRLAEGGSSFVNLASPLGGVGQQVAQ